MASFVWPAWVWMVPSRRNPSGDFGIVLLETLGDLEWP